MSLVILASSLLVVCHSGTLIEGHAVKLQDLAKLETTNKPEDRIVSDSGGNNIVSIAEHIKSNKHNTWKNNKANVNWLHGAKVVAGSKVQPIYAQWVSPRMQFVSSPKITEIAGNQERKTDINGEESGKIEEGGERNIFSARNWFSNAKFLTGNRVYPVHLQWTAPQKRIISRPRPTDEHGDQVIRHDEIFNRAAVDEKTALAVQAQWTAPQKRIISRPRPTDEHGDQVIRKNEIVNREIGNEIKNVDANREWFRDAKVVRGDKVSPVNYQWNEPQKEWNFNPNYVDEDVSREGKMGTVSMQERAHVKSFGSLPKDEFPPQTGMENDAGGPEIPTARGKNWQIQKNHNNGYETHH